MSIEGQIQSSVIAALKELYGQDVPEAMVQLQKTKSNFEGNLTLVVFPLLRISHSKPEDTAQAIGEKLVKAANARLKNGRLTLAEETGDFAGGLILRRGSIEVNCTVELLVELSRSELSAQVAEILFQ